MNVFACIKRVADIGAKFDLTEDRQAISTKNLGFTISPHEECAVEEAVRSMARHGQNSSGVWNAETLKASYETTPDKESPLWNIHSQVIYWWTATEVDEDHAFIIVYDGKVWPRTKDFGPAYLGFRCVKSP